METQPAKTTNMKKIDLYGNEFSAYLESLSWNEQEKKQVPKILRYIIDTAGALPSIMLFHNGCYFAFELLEETPQGVVYYFHKPGHQALLQESYPANLTITNLGQLEADSRHTWRLLNILSNRIAREGAKELFVISYLDENYCFEYLHKMGKAVYYTYKPTPPAPAPELDNNSQK